MGVGLHLRLVMGCIGTWTIINRTPSLTLLAYLTLITLTVLAQQMPTLINAHLLSFDLFAADPAAVLPIQLF